MTDTLLKGVFLSDRPLDANEGISAKEPVVLRIRFRVSLGALDCRELVEEGKPYREWRIPANVINGIASVRLVHDSQLLYGQAEFSRIASMAVMSCR